MELKARLDQGDDLLIIDVREPHEWEISNLDALGAILIPQGQILNRMGELDTAREIVVQCRSGRAARQSFANSKITASKNCTILMAGSTVGPERSIQPARLIDLLAPI